MSFKSSQITPKAEYFNRRRFLGATAGALAFGALPASAAKFNPLNQAGPLHNLTGDAANSRSSVTTYNNFYEFGTGHEDPAHNAPAWKLPANWTVSVEGEVAKPKTLDMDSILKLATIEERIYRHRCVEAWSLVIPWAGIPLSALLKHAEPTGNAKFVAFESYYDPRQMLSSRAAGIRFPYVEGLRMDEAMHPLTLLAVGVYGESLPNQNGAPIRLVVPWKYGFKGIKSITRIRFVKEQPATTWNVKWGEAYGFYSNVNPNRDHPGWSQRREQRLGGGVFGQGRSIETQMFNGYGAQIASLYSGMDLIRNY